MTRVEPQMVVFKNPSVHDAHSFLKSDGHFLHIPVFDIHLIPEHL